MKDFQFYLLCMSHIIKVAVNVYKAPYEQHMPLRHGIYVMALIVIIMLEWVFLGTLRELKYTILPRKMIWILPILSRFNQKKRKTPAHLIKEACSTTLYLQSLFISWKKYNYDAIEMIKKALNVSLHTLLLTLNLFIADYATFHFFSARHTGI